MQFVKILISVILIWTFIGTHTILLAADAQSQPDTGTVVVDASVIRPLGLGTTVIGGALFVVTIPFTIFADTESAWNLLVVEPFEFTFFRPLGVFDDDWKVEQQQEMEAEAQSESTMEVESDNETMPEMETEAAE